MKNTFLRMLTIAGISAIFLTSCQKAAIEPQIPDPNFQNKTAGQKGKTRAAAAAGPSVYALTMLVGAATPVPAGLHSMIYAIDLASPAHFWKKVVKIKIGANPVTDVTGICDMPGVADSAYAVTGQNSNYPNRILGVRLSTGAANIKASTLIPLQDIENYGLNFVAIEEGTSSLFRVNMATGVTTSFAPAGPTAQYNGLAVSGNKFYAMSGQTSLNCSPTLGDIFEYEYTGGAPVASYSYKNLTANASWTGSELGFMYDNAAGHHWVVGSSSQVLSTNANITTCGLSNPTYLRISKPIYDFMVKP